MLEPYINKVTTVTKTNFLLFPFISDYKKDNDIVIKPHIMILT